MGNDRDVLDLGDRAEAVHHEVNDRARPDGQQMLRPAAGNGPQPRGPARREYKRVHPRMVRPSPRSRAYTRAVSVSRMKGFTPGSAGGEWGWTVRAASWSWECSGC